MQYMLLIYGDESQELGEQEMGEIFQAYMKYTEELKAAGAMVAGDPLQPTATATSVRVRKGDVIKTDGPFAETKEQLGGYYLVDVDNLDEALKWAAKIPGAKHGTIEVRPVMAIEQ